ncbi:hypothetical protein RRG08_007602 [Elysia crispata]|uniref:Ig-like domain-containing protein n=1 Tax=Elysia crispata TaxID=231223 RepID=A0AAE1AIJ6_9GAST|nr:hypothetical protein RRG08_007602 [Elysia crispata]
MRRLVLAWILPLSAALILLMVALCCVAAAAEQDLTSHRGKPTNIPKNVWRLKRRKARESNSQDTIYSRHHAFRFHETSTGSKHAQAPLQSGHRGQRMDTSDSQPSHDPLPLALPLSSPGDESTSSENFEPTPQFVFFQPVVKVRPNSLATLPCSVRNLGDRQVVWRLVDKDKFLTIGKTLWSNDDPRILVEHKLEEGGITTWNLLIKSVNSSDAGTYQCQITSSEGIMMNVQLKVEEPTTTIKPKMTVLKKVTHRDFRNTRNDAADEQRYPQREEHLTVGMPIRLQCNTSVEKFSSAWKIQMHWYKEGYAIKPSKHTLVTWHQREADMMYVCELYIDKSIRADSGQYHCKVNSQVLEAVMIYVLPNTTIGSEPKDSHSNYYSVGSLTTNDGAAALVGWQTSWFSTLAICIFSLLFSSSFSVICNCMAVVIDKHMQLIDQT